MQQVNDQYGLITCSLPNLKQFLIVPVYGLSDATIALGVMISIQKYQVWRYLTKQSTPAEVAAGTASQKKTAPQNSNWQEWMETSRLSLL